METEEESANLPSLRLSSLRQRKCQPVVSIFNDINMRFLDLQDGNIIPSYDAIFVEQPFRWGNQVCDQCGFDTILVSANLLHLIQSNEKTHLVEVEVSHLV